MSFSDDEVGRALPVAVPLDPDSGVCPTKAIHQGASGVPEIDGNLCVGCGLCVQRCPVGAISLRSDDALATVRPPSGRPYVARPYERVRFLAARKELEARILPQAGPFADAGLVETQVLRLEHALAGRDAQRAYRLLTRNLFLTQGLPARLKNVGDVTGPWTELAVAGDGNGVFSFEIEPGTDLLDALRRAISGMAIATVSLGLPQESITPSIVLTRLPNGRVDYYRVLSDLREILGVEVRTIPVAALLLAIRAGRAPLTSELIKRSYVDESVTSLREPIQELFGTLENAEAVGLAISK